MEDEGRDKMWDARMNQPLANWMPRSAILVIHSVVVRRTPSTPSQLKTFLKSLKDELRGSANSGFSCAQSFDSE